MQGQAISGGAVFSNRRPVLMPVLVRDNLLRNPGIHHGTIVQLNGKLQATAATASMGYVEGRLLIGADQSGDIALHRNIK